MDAQQPSQQTPPLPPQQAHLPTLPTPLPITAEAFLELDNQRAQQQAGAFHGHGVGLPGLMAPPSTEIFYGYPPAPGGVPGGMFMPAVPSPHGYQAALGGLAATAAPPSAAGSYGYPLAPGGVPGPINTPPVASWYGYSPTPGGVGAVNNQAVRGVETPYTDLLGLESDFDYIKFLNLDLPTEAQAPLPPPPPPPLSHTGGPIINGALFPVKQLPPPPPQPMPWVPPTRGPNINNGAFYTPRQPRPSLPGLLSTHFGRDNNIFYLLGHHTNEGRMNEVAKATVAEPGHQADRVLFLLLGRDSVLGEGRVTIKHWARLGLNRLRHPLRCGGQISDSPPRGNFHLQTINVNLGREPPAEKGKGKQPPQPQSPLDPYDPGSYYPISYWSRYRPTAEMGEYGTDGLTKELDPKWDRELILRLAATAWFAGHIARDVMVGRKPAADAPWAENFRDNGVVVVAPSPSPAPSSAPS